MRRVIAAIIVYLGLAVAALAQSGMPFPSQSVSFGTVAAITRIVAAPSAGAGASKQIVVTQIFAVPVATSVVTFSYGTGTNCGTGTTVLVPAMTFATGQTLSAGDGLGPVMIVPAGNDLCITIATAAAPGNLTYTVVP